MTSPIPGDDGGKAEADAAVLDLNAARQRRATPDDNLPDTAPDNRPDTEVATAGDTSPDNGTDIGLGGARVLFTAHLPLLWAAHQNLAGGSPLATPVVDPGTTRGEVVPDEH